MHGRDAPARQTSHRGRAEDRHAGDEEPSSRRRARQRKDGVRREPDHGGDERPNDAARVRERGAGRAPGAEDVRADAGDVRDARGRGMARDGRQHPGAPRQGDARRQPVHVASVHRQGARRPDGADGGVRRDGTHGKGVRAAADRACQVPEQPGAARHDARSGDEDAPHLGLLGRARAGDRVRTAVSSRLVADAVRLGRRRSGIGPGDMDQGAPRARDDHRPDAARDGGANDARERRSRPDCGVRNAAGVPLPRTGDHRRGPLGPGAAVGGLRLGSATGIPGGGRH